MNRRRFIIILIIIIFSNFSVLSDTNIYLQGEIQNSPWFYEPFYEMNCIRISTAWMLGVEFDWFTAGLDIFCNYVSLDGRKDSYLFKGALFNLGGNILTKYKLTTWMELSISAGFLWNQSSFDLNNSGWLGRSIPGFEIVAGSIFFFTDYLHLEILNRLDFLLYQNNLSYTVGTRVYFYPGIHWLNLYAELDAFYWQYKSELLTEGVNTWMFQAQIGVSLYFNKKRAKSTSVDTGINEKQYIDPTLAQLHNSKAGETLLFYTILFNDEEINDKSLPVLDELAGILNENKSMVISISGYAEFILDPLKELELCKIRSHYIKKYLVTKGVKDIQIQLNPVGNIITDKKTYITIDVLKNNLHK